MNKLLALLFCLPLFAQAKLQVATTTTDLAALVREVGKDRVEVFAVAKGTQDPHQIEAKPSFMVKLRNTQLIVAHGLELETAWLDPLIQGSRNAELAKKGAVLELAGLLQPIEIPTGAVSRAEGDVHPGGNPHFQLDPIRLGQGAVILAEKMAALDSVNKDFYTQNAQTFQKLMESKTKEWQARLKKTGISEVVTYHKSFSYFLDRFGIKSTLQLEPKPGIPPTASHLMEVISQMKARHIPLVLIENYYDDSAAGKLKQEIPGVRVERVPVSVEGGPSIKTNIDLIEKLVKTFEGAK